MDFVREVRPNTVRIKLHKKIGQGLSSNVFEGVRIDSRGFTSQVVAVKITKSQEDIDGLKREFEALLQVQSDHLVKVFAWDNHGEESLLSMEHIEGVSLADLFDTGLLDEVLVEEIISQMQEGLKALAAKGLKHGDLSLNNALVRKDGVVKLIDLANPENSQVYIQGTPPYLAPEVWEGEPTTIESDLFALGLIREDLLAKVNQTHFLPPQCLAEGRKRCFERTAGRDAVGWLSPRRGDRVFLNRTLSPTARARLAAVVQKLQSSSTHLNQPELSSPLSGVISSQPLRHSHSRPMGSFGFSAGKNRWWGARVLAFFCTPIVGLTLISACWTDHSNEGSRIVAKATLPVGVAEDLSERVGAETRAGPIKIALAPGSLSIRSHRWMSVEIGNRSLGYAPISTSGLTPGHYLLKWQTQSKVGVKSIVIRSGRETTLQDSDF